MLRLPFTFALFCTLTVLGACNELFDVFLLNITIFQDHEANQLFVENYPEVYLSCEDGLPSVELNQVRRTKQLYQFRVGDIKATQIVEYGCVFCSLKESDPSALLKDDIFGDFNICYADFIEDQNVTVEEPGEFIMVFSCPNCILPLTAPPSETIQNFDEIIEAAISSVEIEEEAAISSIAMEEDQIEEVTEYYTTFFTSDGDKGNVVLQSDRNEMSGNGNRTSKVTILLLCFTFLIIGILLGVLLWKRVMKREQERNCEAIQLSKMGFVAKSAKW